MKRFGSILIPLLLILAILFLPVVGVLQTTSPDMPPVTLAAGSQESVPTFDKVLAVAQSTLPYGNLGAIFLLTLAVTFRWSLLSTMLRFGRLASTTWKARVAFNRLCIRSTPA